ncbi:hypothetical protein [Streptomyces sp. B1-3]|uniref:hypothetical protein n=1 Tax=Streptomyces sp. B1-3 TaxID=3141453 RepID=UPI003D277BC3
MTRVTLRVRYSSRTASGIPGQTLDLDDAAAQRLINSGRARLATDLPPVDDEDQEQEQGKQKSGGGVRAVRSRAKAKESNDRHTTAFYDPDETFNLFDPTYGRR